jgi:hypothetical protein
MRLKTLHMTKKITGYVPSKTFQPLFIGDESQALETGVL